MPEPRDDIRRALETIARRERGQLIADLVYRLGFDKIDLAEDVTQDSLVAAMSVWSYQGMPDNPSAWLRRVIRNKAIDRLRREGREISWSDDVDNREADTIVEPALVNDPELRLIFLTCHDAIGPKDRLAMMLKVVSGFTAREIASLFLESEAALSQRIARAKRILRTALSKEVDTLSRFHIRKNMSIVLKGIYLMFALGYAPRTGQELIRREVALEALRLVRELAGQDIAAEPAAHALAALLCFQASRFNARETSAGDIILLKDQDRDLWDFELIDEGRSHLEKAQLATSISEYHLKAGIASAHAMAPSWLSTDWNSINSLYRKLRDISASPVVTINASIALLMSGRSKAACELIETLEALPCVNGFAPFHLAKAEILKTLKRHDEAQSALEAAKNCTNPDPVARLIELRLSGPG